MLNMSGAAYRQSQIIDLLKQSPMPLTRKQIFLALGMTESDWAVKQLETLVLSQKVARGYQAAPSGRRPFLYALPINPPTD